MGSPSPTLRLGGRRELRLVQCVEQFLDLINVLPEVLSSWLGSGRVPDGIGDHILGPSVSLAEYIWSCVLDSYRAHGVNVVNMAPIMAESFDPSNPYGWEDYYVQEIPFWVTVDAHKRDAPLWQRGVHMFRDAAF